jgi:hypothetical protein
MPSGGDRGALGASVVLGGVDYAAREVESFARAGEAQCYVEKPQD